jgi:hypothetical protein
MCLFICFWCDSPQWARASSFTRFLDHTQRRTTVGRTPLDEWSARRRDLYLTTHNTHNRQTLPGWYVKSGYFRLRPHYSTEVTLESNTYSLLEINGRFGETYCSNFQDRIILVHSNGGTKLLPDYRVLCLKKWDGNIKVDVKIKELDWLLQARFQWSLVNTPIRF